MVMSLLNDRTAPTFLTPGQKFEPAELCDLGSESLTVSRLVRDRFGLMHVTLRTMSGREISAYVEQVEFAVSEGHLVPVNHATSIIAC